MPPPESYVKIDSFAEQNKYRKRHGEWKRVVSVTNFRNALVYHDTRQQTTLRRIS